MNNTEHDSTYGDVKLRLTIYIEMLAYIKSELNDNFNCGFCRAFNYALGSEPNNIERLPELLNYRPNDYLKRSYWFVFDDECIRIKILEEIIANMTKDV